MDTLLLNNILVVTSPAHFIAVTPSNSSLSPPTVRRTRWVSVLCGLIYAKMWQYVTVLPLGNLPLGMKKIMLFPFGMRVPTPRDSLPRSLVNAFIHTYDSGPCRIFLFSCDIPVMVSMTALASKLLHASCDVRFLWPGRIWGRSVITGIVLVSLNMCLEPLDMVLLWR